MKKNIHIVKGRDGWNVKTGGSIVSTSSTQNVAINTGRNMAIAHGSELVIHGRDGKIRDKRSYGNDPFPPRG